MVYINLEAKHRITRILNVLRVPRTTYYDYLNWKSSEQRQLLKEKVLTAWLSYLMYGYPRMTQYFNDDLAIPISRYLIYRLMCELGIHSRMIKKMKKPKNYCEVAQLPNLIRKMTD